MSFERAFHDVVMVEGGYANDPSDSGGKTMWGITEAVARRNGYQGEMRNMPLEKAKAIYWSQYWDLLRLDGVDALSAAIAHELFDTAVNCGVGVAGVFLQRALNAFNRQQTLYPDIAVDGLIGPGTLHAFRAYMQGRGTEGETVMLRALNSLQGERYIRLAEQREKDERFVFGWFSKRVT